MNYKLFKFVIYFIRIFSCCASPILSNNHMEFVVQIGTNTHLDCSSNDKFNNFMFWELPDDSVIGPGNENSHNHSKYSYEVLSGQLYINSVSFKEEGFYKCVSQGVRTDDINISTVKLIVRKDWEEVYEDDSSVNYIRILVVFGCLVIIVLVVFYLVKILKPTRSFEILE